MDAFVILQILIIVHIINKDEIMLKILVENDKRFLQIIS